jgi:hypothetical protein
VLVIDRWPSHPWIALVSWPFAAGVTQHVRVRLELKAGDPRSLTKTNGDAGFHFGVPSKETRSRQTALSFANAPSAASVKRSSRPGPSAK